MVPEISSGILIPIQSTPDKSFILDIIKAKLRATDYIVMLGWRFLEVCIPNVSSGNIQSIECCIGQRNTHTLPGYNASICGDLGFSCFMAFQYPSRFPSEIHPHIKDNMSCNHMPSNRYVLRVLQYLKCNSYVHRLLFYFLAPEIISIHFVYFSWMF